MQLDEDTILKTNWLVGVALVALSLVVVAALMVFAGPRLGIPGFKSSPDALATVRFVAGSDEKPALTAPTGTSLELVPASGGNVSVVRLSGVKPGAGAGGLPGIYLPLTEAFENAASGETVIVTITARRAPNSSQADFAASYSTNEVGNSGWHGFKLTDELASHSFTYDVPRIASGKGDYIGILPDPSGAGGAVDVSEIYAEVVPRGKTDKLAPAGAATTSTTTP